MNNFKMVSVADGARQELHDTLGLTGAEISINVLLAGASVPFVHAHKQNEEIYAILEGEGSAVIDGESVNVKAGDWLRIAPSAKRRFSASANAALKYICIQVKENSLQGYTINDAIIL